MPGISVDLRSLRRKVSTDAFERGQFNMSQRMHATMNESSVPMRDGNLRTLSNVSPDGKSIEWNAPYARRHYYAPGGWNYTTPGTGPRWDLKAKSVFISDWLEAFKKGAGF
jgi:hypothetical protein